MEVKNIYLSRMHNGEHVNYNLESLTLMEKSSPDSMGVVVQVNDYRVAVESQQAAMAVFSASDLSLEAVKRDGRRDRAFSAFKAYCKVYANDADAGKAAAAERLLSIIRNAVVELGDPLRMGLSKESAMLAELVKVLEPVRADIELIGGLDRYNELTTAMREFDELQIARIGEKAGKGSGDVKAARAVTDDAYRAVIKRINALALIQGDAAFAGYIREQNTLIDKYAALIARRKNKTTTTKEQKTPQP